MFQDPSETPTELTTGIEALVKEQVKSLSSFPTTNTRKGRQRRREMILEENTAPIICQKLYETFYNPEIKRRIEHHISEEFILAADVTRAIACVYKRPPIRSFRDGSDAENKALIKINEATRRSAKAEHINRMAWFTGPVLEVPVVQNGKLTVRVIPGSQVDVQMSDDDPLGHPVACAYRWVEQDDWVIKVLDDVNQYTFNREGRLLYDTPHGITGPDGEPRMPATLWRFDEPTRIDDYWSTRRNERLVAATTTAGMIFTKMDWVRKGQDRNLMIAMGNLDNLSAGSGMDNETPALWMVGERDEMPKFEVKDISTSVDEFIKHIQYVSQTQIQAFGIPASAINFSFGDSGAVVMELSLQHDQLTQLRNKQIRFALEGEIRSQYNLYAVAREAGHSLAEDLPADPADFAERLSIEFSDLVRVEDPQTTKLQQDNDLQRGLITLADLYMAKHPDVTKEEADAAVMANLEQNAKYFDLMARRNMDPQQRHLDPGEETGGQRSDPEPDDDEETNE